MLAFIVSEADNAQWTTVYDSTPRFTALGGIRCGPLARTPLGRDPFASSGPVVNARPTAYHARLSLLRDLVFDLSNASRSENRGSDFGRLERPLSSFVCAVCWSRGAISRSCSASFRGTDSCLLQRLSREILQHAEDPSQPPEMQAADTAIERMGSNGKQVVLVFDEIEYITPLSTTDSHWARRLCPVLADLPQSLGNLAVLLGGVNRRTRPNRRVRIRSSASSRTHMSAA